MLKAVKTTPMKDMNKCKKYFVYIFKNTKKSRGRVTTINSSNNAYKFIMYLKLVYFELVN